MILLLFNTNNTSLSYQWTLQDAINISSNTYNNYSNDIANKKLPYITKQIAKHLYAMRYVIENSIKTVTKHVF